MSLAAAFKAAALAAFEAAGDVRVSATLKTIGSPSYNPDTGTMSGATTSSYPIKAVMVDLSSEDKMGEHVDGTASAYLVLGSEIDGITPVPGDILTLGSSDCVILDVVTDPVKAVWEIGI